LIRTQRESEEIAETGILEIIPVSEKIIRVRYTERDSFMEKEDYSLIPVQSFTEWQVTTKEMSVQLKTICLCVEINKSTCAITWKDSQGEILVREPEEGGKILQSIDVEKIVYDSEKEIINIDSIDV
jgi:alpha-D-xyloside xylohydrolase